jgi:tetratricopeptide (TPR) repeat protein
MVNEDDQLLIGRYLDGSLPSNERGTLRARLENEPELNAFMVQEEELRAWVGREAKVSATMDFLGTLTPGNTDIAIATNVDQKDKPSASKAATVKPLWRRPAVRIAAGMIALLFLVAAALWWLPTGNDNFTHRPLGNTMGETTTAAMRAYNQGDYATALPLLRQQNNVSPSPDWQLAEAVSLLELERYAEALSLLDELERNAPLYQDAANYYAGVAHFRSDGLALAQESLKKVPQNSFYGPPAARLLKKI